MTEPFKLTSGGSSGDMPIPVISQMSRKRFTELLIPTTLGFGRSDRGRDRDKPGASPDPAEIPCLTSKRVFGKRRGKCGFSEICRGTCACRGREEGNRAQPSLPTGRDGKGAKANDRTDPDHLRVPERVRPQPRGQACSPKCRRCQRTACQTADHRTNFLCFIRLGSSASAPRRRFLSSS